VEKIDVPTLFVQGTVDTLFTLAEAVTNHRILAERGVPTGMLWFCGGHGSCLTKAGDPERVGRQSLAWLDRYLAGDESVEAGPALDLVDQDGVRWTADHYPGDEPDPDDTTVSGSGSGTLDLTIDPAPAPFTPPPGTSDVLTMLVSDITPTRAGHAVEVAVDSGDTDGLALGAPTLHLSYSGTVEEGPRPTRVFAQLVDDTTGVVLGNQVTPIAVELDGETHRVTVALEVVAHHLTPGHGVTLQLIAATSAYAETNRAGSITFDDISIDVPVASDVRPSA
jgi:ABC-2 type transport system ATP-binding protein